MKQFTCIGDGQSIGFDRYYDDPDVICHNMVDGSRLWEIHGREDGNIVADVELDPGDWVVCCYPRRVKNKYPFAAVAADYHNGVVVAHYRPHPRKRGRQRYTVTVIPTHST